MSMYEDLCDWWEDSGPPRPSHTEWINIEVLTALAREPNYRVDMHSVSLLVIQSCALITRYWACFSYAVGNAHPTPLAFHSTLQREHPRTFKNIPFLEDGKRGWGWYHSRWWVASNDGEEACRAPSSSSSSSPTLPCRHRGNPRDWTATSGETGFPEHPIPHSHSLIPYGSRFYFTMLTAELIGTIQHPLKQIQRNSLRLWSRLTVQFVAEKPRLQA